MIIKPIPGWSGYFATDEGDIISTKRKKACILRPAITDGGRATVAPSSLSKQKPIFVHRLVLLAFRGKCPDGMECAHLDGNPLNNRLSNLIWTTHVENENHKELHGTKLRGEKIGTSRLVASDVVEIKRQLELGVMGTILAEKYKVTRDTIYHIKSGRNWGHITHHGGPI